MNWNVHDSDEQLLLGKSEEQKKEFYEFQERRKKEKQILDKAKEDGFWEKINYKYDEGNILSELKEYIDSTYDEHYSKNKFQATEFIIDGGHGEGFCIGNIMKYAQRYGKKGGKNRRDLLKVIHYGIIALYINEMEESENETK